MYLKVTISVQRRDFDEYNSHVEKNVQQYDKKRDGNKLVNKFNVYEEIIAQCVFIQ